MQRGFELPVVQAFHGAASPGCAQQGRHAGDGAGAAGGKRELQHHRKLDSHGLLTLMHELRRSFLSIALLSTLAACGGSSNPLSNPPAVSNPDAESGHQHLAFAYFQKCINPIIISQLQIPGSATTNTCAGSGCHDTVTGTGGAFRIVPAA